MPYTHMQGPVQVVQVWNYLICMFFLFICAIYTMFKFFQVSRCPDTETE